MNCYFNLIFFHFYFIFRLLYFYFKDFIYIIPFFIFFLYIWVFFIKISFFNIRLNPDFNDVLVNSNFFKKNHYLFFLNWAYYNFFPFFLFVYFMKLDFCLFWFNHLKVNNFVNNIIIFVIFTSIFLFKIVSFIENKNVNYNLDYFFAVFNLIIFVPIVFLSNTAYTFVFILELISILILYKFSVSRNFNLNINSTFFKPTLKPYLNMIFFQYWSNFFSSMLILISIFSVIFIYGSSDWFLLEFLNNCSKNNFSLIKNYFFVYMWTFFLFGVFLKIGFTPLHLFKIEVYKGLPFISIFFYTTWYFLSFFLYFVVLLYINLYSFGLYLNIIFFITIFSGVIYIIFLLFDVNAIKSFFAYSTIINVVNFIIILYLLIN